MDLRRGWPTATSRAAEKKKKNPNKPCLSLKNAQKYAGIEFLETVISAYRRRRVQD